MISLTRQRTATVIPTDFTGDTRKLWEKELLENERKIKKGELDRHKFLQSRWKKVKDQLKLEAYDKCAYCEAPNSMVAYGDVEHYRPKSVYWWLAYNYDNYLVSCQLCNQSYKSDNFPVKNARIKAPTITKTTKDDYILSIAGKCTPDPLDNSGMLLSEFITAHNTERPYLLNPYFDEPADYYAWRADDILREVELVPLPNTTEFVQSAIDYYGLNRKELRDLRYRIYYLYTGYKLVLTDTGISDITRRETKQRIEYMKGNKAPFAGMIRYFENLL